MPRWMFLLPALIGASLFVYGAVADPFAIPFQDFEELPTDVKERYFRGAEIARYMRYAGGSLLVLSFVVFRVCSKRKRSVAALREPRL